MNGKWQTTSAVGSGVSSGAAAATTSGPSFGEEVRTGDAKRWWPRLKGMLEEQRTVCLRLDEMSRKQQELVRAGDTASVLTVLGERQGMVDELQRLSAEMEPFRSRRQELLSRVSDADRNGYERLVEEISGLVESVKTRDDQDRVEMEKQRNEVTSELTGMFRGRGAVAAYGGTSKVNVAGASIQDRQG